jgi:hypothetical protein
VPWTAIAVFLAAAALAAVILLLVNQPWETAQQTESATTTATAGQAVAVPKPETQAELRAWQREAGATVAQPAYRLNPVEGTTVGMATSSVLQATAGQAVVVPVQRGRFSFVPRTLATTRLEVATPPAEPGEPWKLRHADTPTL